jgi:hypothetical protein
LQDAQDVSQPERVVSVALAAACGSGNQILNEFFDVNFELV